MSKTLNELAAMLPGSEIIGDADLVISDIEHDSRKVTQGTMFVCMTGTRVDGHSFIPQAK